MRRTASSKLSLAVMLGSLAAFVAPYSATAAPAPVLTQTSSSSSAVVQMSADDIAFAAGDAVADQGLGALTLKADEDYVRDGQVAGTDGIQYLHYQKTFEGLEVIGADAVVTADSTGEVLDTTAATQASVAVSDTTPTVDAAKAVAAARDGYSKVDSAVQEHVVVFLDGSTPKLAWEVSVEGTRDGKPSVQEVFVDANTGAVLRRDELVKEAVEASGTGNHNGKVKFTTTQSGSSYSMVSTAARGLQCGGQSNSPFTDSDNVWGNGSGTDMPTACVDAMYAGEVQAKMLKEWANRDGINGKGGFYPARVGLSDVNAYWNGSFANFGRNSANNKQATPIDVVAHEFGHGLFQFSGGSANGNEAGGMNESTGDIIGASTECYQDNGSVSDKCDYDVGEMVDLAGRGPIRIMSDPSKLRDPNCATQLNGNTEVHSGAGPQNHWFYLLAEGSNPTNGQPKSPICSGGPSVVNGIGIQKATNIFVAGLQRKTSSWNHKAARVATLTAAKALYPSSCTEFNATKDAWAAIAVPAQSGEPTCTISTPTDDFSVSLSPTSGSVKAGASATSTLSTKTTAGQAQNVSLSASGLPSGATATFAPTSVSTGSSSTMTIKTGTTTPAGTSQVTVTATGGTIKTATYSLTVSSDGGPGPGPGKAPDISVDAAKAHLAKFQSIADSNNGNRRAGNSGYTASVDYVTGKLQAAGYTVSKQRCTTPTCSAASDNIIAEWPGGDASKVIMFGAHLDGVSAGPGINDNGSGSAGILEVALTLAAQKPTMLNKVRFAWWTDEEQGLNGSKFYVNNLSSAEKTKIKAYYNFDMIASTNAGYFINNINTPQSAPMKEYWDSLKLAPEENVEGAGRSDDYSFKNAGIPSSGYAMGASARKTAAQANKWGGTANQGYDPCYHARCDTYPANVNLPAFDRAIDGIAYTLWKQAVGSSDPEPETDDYSIAVNPSSASVKAGDSTTATVDTKVTEGKTQTVALTASGAPAGTTVSFSPTSVKAGGTSTMSVKTTSSTTPGKYTITVNGDGTVDRTATFTLTVTGVSTPDADEYSMSVNPSSATVQAGDSATASVKTTVTKGKAQNVALSASGAPDGTTVSFAPTTVQSGASSTMTAKTSASTPAGSYTITVNGAGTYSTSTTFTLTVTGVTTPDADEYSMSVNPSSATVQAGDSATASVKTTVTKGKAQNVALSASGAPDGTTVSFAPTTVQSGASSTMTAKTSASTPAGSYTITINGAGTYSTSTAFTLTVTAEPGGGEGAEFFNGTDYYIYNNYTIASWINSDYNQQVRSATIKYDIQHSCVQDLDIWLVAPDGSYQKVEQSSRNRCRTRDGFVTKKVTFKTPVDASGYWRLQISDNGYYNPGMLYSWYLTLP